MSNLESGCPFSYYKTSEKGFLVKVPRAENESGPLLLINGRGRGTIPFKIAKSTPKALI